MAKKKKSSAMRQRIAHHPSYERIRENMAEFETAGKASKLISDSLRLVAASACDQNMISRLTQQMVEVVKTDAVSDRGKRIVTNGDLKLLKSFEFNVNGKLSTVLFAPSLATIDRAAGTLKVELPAFVPKQTIKAPPTATHFALVSAAAEIDFNADDAVNIATAITAPMPLNAEETEAITLSNALTANSVNPLLLAMGIRFFQEVNGKYYTLHAGRYNALAIVKVDAPLPPAPAPAAAA